MRDFIEKIFKAIKNIFYNETKKLPEKANNVSSGKDFLAIEKEKSQKYNYLINLQKKLRQGIIKETDLDEEDYMELELLYKKQIHEKENKIKNIITKIQMS